MREVFDQYYAALRTADAAAAGAVLEAALQDGHSHVRLMREVVARGQQRVGQAWADGSLSIADEHAATSTAEQALAVLVHSGPAPAPGSGRRIALACAEGEWHSMPARLAGEQARAAGLDVVMLGGSLPADQLHRHLVDTRPDALALSVTLGSSLVGACRSIAAAHRTGVPVIVGGAAWGPDGRRAEALGADHWLSDARQLPEAIERVIDIGELRETPDLDEVVDVLSHAPAELAAQTLVNQRAASSLSDTPTPEQLRRQLSDYRWLMRYTAAGIACRDPAVVSELVDWLVAARMTPHHEADWAVLACGHLADALESTAPLGSEMLRSEVSRRGGVHVPRPTPPPVAATGSRSSTDLLVSALAREVEASARLREVDRIKDDLVASVSHELRTPLTTILGCLEILREEDPGHTERQRTLLAAMDRSSERLLALVDDLLTVALDDAHPLHPRPQRIDLRDVVSSVHHASQATIDRRRVRVTVITPTVPVVVEGDARRLAHAVGNLLGNAIKFTEDGGSVQCTVEATESHARLTVADDGIGIPGDEQHRLFTRFFRATTAIERAIPGSGLGLSIAASIVDDHGGTITLTSGPGPGTRVVIDLPLAVPVVQEVLDDHR